MMFDPTREVPRLDLCQQLKKLGFPQETGGFYWRKFKDGWKVDYIPYISVVKRMIRQGVIVKAPTFIELWRYLPKKFKTPKDKYAYLYIKKENNMMQIEYDIFTLSYPSFYIKSIYPSELDSICKICIWLREKGYIKFNKEASDDNSD